MSAIDSLIRVAPVLYNKRISELRDEVEALKDVIRRRNLEIFWRDYSSDHLRGAAANWNFWSRGAPCCACLNCMMGGRTDKKNGDSMIRGQNHNTFNCDWQAPFEKLIRDSGFVVASVCGCGSCCSCMGGGEKRVAPSPEFSHWGGNANFDIDAHIVLFARHDWVCFAAGRKLWNASSVDDVELVRYKNFIDMLVDIQ